MSTATEEQEQELEKSPIPNSRLKSPSKNPTSTSTRRDMKLVRYQHPLPFPQYPIALSYISIQYSTTILLRVTYTPTYPEEPPLLALSLPPPDSDTIHPLTFPSDEPPLLEAINTAVEENIGMAMVFTLTTTLKEAAETILRSRADEAQRIRDEAARLEEEKEMEKFRGELVTKEVFERWMEEFKKEMKEKKEAEEREREEAELKSGRRSGNVSGTGAGGKKLTGRELFERGLVGGLDDDVDDDDNGGEEETPDVGKLEIKA
ncbi:hypothetical protein AA313_de0209113 [Arthrobotrys entomopaga]|nr:hypothetical protein AA313_de0209113 [Arthrobotrys entomopaga]